MKRFQLILGTVAASLAVVGVSSAVGPAAPFAVQLVAVNAPTQADRTRLASLGLDVTEHGGPGSVDVVLHSASDAEALRNLGFTWKVVIPDLGLRELRNNEISAA